MPDPGDFLGGLLLGVIGGAVLDSIVTQPARQTAVQQAYSQGAQDQRYIDWAEINRRDLTIAKQSDMLHARDAEIARLNEVVQNQSRALVQGQWQQAPALPPPGSNSHHPNGLQ